VLPGDTPEVEIAKEKESTDPPIVVNRAELSRIGGSLCGPGSPNMSFEVVTLGDDLEDEQRPHAWTLNPRRMHIVTEAFERYPMLDTFSDRSRQEEFAARGTRSVPLRVQSGTSLRLAADMQPAASMVAREPSVPPPGMAWATPDVPGRLDTPAFGAMGSQHSDVAVTGKRENTDNVSNWTRKYTDVRRTTKFVVQHWLFDYVIGLVLAANAITIGAQVEY